MYLVIDLMQAATGNRPAQFSGGALLSDVLTIVTTGGVCSQTNPCQTIFDDFGQVVLRTPLKDITNPSSPNAPTTNNEVTINRYRVVYRRTDGRNTQGVDVPYAFDGGVTGTVPLGGTLTLAFELVRHVAKVEPPLVAAAEQRRGHLHHRRRDLLRQGPRRPRDSGNRIDASELRKLW